jgi:hypothetical protein
MTESNAGSFQVFKGKGGDQKADGKNQAEAKSFAANVGHGIQHYRVE